MRQPSPAWRVTSVFRFSAPRCLRHISRKKCAAKSCAKPSASQNPAGLSQASSFFIISNLKLILTIVFVVSLGKNVLNLVDLFLGYAKRNKQAGEAPAAAGKQKK